MLVLKLRLLGRKIVDMDIVVVRVLIEDSNGTRKFNGTAFFINSNTLITARHVVESSIKKNYSIYLTDIPNGGNQLVLPNDIDLCKRDIAIINVKKEFDTVQEIGFTDKLKIESQVKLIGYHNKDGSINFYNQIISGYTNNEHTYEIQDARTNGLSGSPVILDGRVCGIAQAISSKKNVTYIIPISECNIEFIQNRLSSNDLDKKNIINISKILDTSSFRIFLSRRYENTLQYEKEVENVFSKKDFKVKILSIYAYDFNLLEEFSKLFNTNEVSLESNIHRMLNKSNDKYLLIIKNFEDINIEVKERFANLLRSLIEDHPNFYLIIFGGKKLAQLAYGNGNMSLFSNADVQLAENEDSNLSTIITTLTGSHPKLNSLCKNMEEKRDEDFYRKSLISSANLPMIFKGYNDIEKLCRCFEETSFGLYNLWHADELIRDLFWENLLKELDGKLVWRSEFIREIGKSLKCL